MTRLVRCLVVAATLVVLAAAPVSADHTHVKELGNGECILLAAGGGEEAVVLPPAVFDRNPNVDVGPILDRSHPLHVLVHRGVPGDQRAYEVAGTAEATALCEDGIVND